ASRPPAAGWADVGACWTSGCPGRSRIGPGGGCATSPRADAQAASGRMMAACSRVAWKRRRSPEQDQRGQAKESEEAHRVGDGGEEDSARQGRIESQALERYRDEYPRGGRQQKVAGERCENHQRQSWTA